VARLAALRVVLSPRLELTANHKQYRGFPAPPGALWQVLTWAREGVVDALDLFEDVADLWTAASFQLAAGANEPVQAPYGRVGLAPFAPNGQLLQWVLQHRFPDRAALTSLLVLDYLTTSRPSTGLIFARTFITDACVARAPVLPRAKGTTASEGLPAGGVARSFAGERVWRATGNSLLYEVQSESMRRRVRGSGA